MTLDTQDALPLPGDFYLGDWLVLPGLCSMTLGERVVKLRPQHLAFIVCLARNPNRTLTKGEILSAVWPGQYVQESGLARCVAELRQALGDEARDSRFILTVPKIGYRLIAPVRWVDETTKAEPSGADSNPAPATRSRGRGLWLVPAVLVVALAAAFAVWLTTRPRPAPEPGAVVVVFENLTRDPSFEGALGLALAVGLEQSTMLTVVPEARVREELRFIGRGAGEPLTRQLALEACQRVGAKALLAGSINALGSRYAIGLEAVVCQSGSVLLRQQVEVARKEEVLGRLGEAVSSIRARLGETLASIRRHEVPIVQATTSSLEALKAVSLGDAERAMGRDAQAIDLYRQAVSIDPGFALAHARLASHLLNLGRTGEAVEELKLAYAASAKVSVPERYNIAGLYYSRVARDPFRAIEAFQTWRDQYPRDPLPRMALASLYGHTGRFEAALEEARAAEKLDPGHAVIQAVILDTLLALGRLDEARRIGTTLEAEGRAGANVHLALFELAFIGGDKDAMRREMELAPGNRTTESAFVRLHAASAAFEGRFRDAGGLWKRASDIARASGDATDAALAQLENGEACALAGRKADASGLVGSALGMSRAPEVLLHAAVVAGFNGDPNRAEALLAESARAESPDPSSDPELRPLLSALIALGRGRSDAAVAALEPMRPFEIGRRFMMRPTFARGLALMAGTRAAEAAAEFQRIVDHRGLLAADVLYPVACLHLSRALAASGDGAGSERARATVLGFWKAADPPLDRR